MYFDAKAYCLTGNTKMLLYFPGVVFIFKIKIA